MYRTLFLMALTAALVGCKPTPRTVPAPQGNQPTTEQPVSPADEQTETPPAPSPAPQVECADAIVLVRSALQGYDPMQPWQRTDEEHREVLGIYIGDGRVLTSGDALKNATYVELALPDGSRTAPARIIKQNAELGLGLLTVQEGADLSLFESRRALELGEPLTLNGHAELVGLVNGLNPVHLPLRVGGVEGLCVLTCDMPTIPDAHEKGAPIISDGKLVGMTCGYDDGVLRVQNADKLNRFLSDDFAGVPLLGVHFGSLDDPVLRRYLRVQDSGGLYISRVYFGGAGEKAGLREGDVVIAVDGLPIDAQGRCESPLYGRYHALSLMCGTKNVGEKLRLTLCREGKTEEVELTLDRSAVQSGILSETAPGEAPRYILWGGLLFQPLNKNYLDALSRASGNDIPRPILSVQRAAEQGKNAGVREPVALTMVIPTPATLGYERARFTVVTAVNGKPVHDFKEFENLLDEPTDNGLTRISVNSEPYDIYIDRAAAERANDRLRRTSIPNLRVVGTAEESVSEPE